MKRVLSRHLILLLGMLVLGVLVFLPILADIGNRILGSVDAGNTRDGYQNIWNFWWAEKNCLGFCGNMWYTDFQFFPQGVNLLFETWAYPSLFIFTPLVFVGAQAATAYNVALIFAVVTSLFSAYLLVYYLTKKRLAAFIGAIVYGLSPFIVGHILDGQLNLTNIQYFPLFLLFLLKSNKEKGRLYKILCGLTLLLLGLNDFVFLLFAFIIWVIFFFYNFSIAKNKAVPLIKKNALILGIFILPFFALTFNNFKEMNNFELSGMTNWNAQYSSANLASFFTPPSYTLAGSEYFPQKYQQYSGIFSDKSIYLGIFPLILSALGVLYLRKKREIWLWLSLATVSFIFSLGPIIQLFDKKLEVWMPFRVFQYIPILNIIRTPSRFTVIVFLVLSVLCGYGICYLQQRVKSKKIISTIIILVGLGILIEYYPIVSPETDLYLPDGYKKIMEDTSDFAILESPPLWMSGLKNAAVYYPIESLYYQTIHQKKMASGYATRVPIDLMDAYADTPILRYIINTGDAKSLSPEVRRVRDKYKDIYIKNTVADNPYKYLVINKNPNWKDIHLEIKQTLKDHLVPFYEDTEVEIYTFK